MADGAADDDGDLAVRCAACEQREDALDNMSRKRFKINTACGHYFCDTCIQREFARKTRGAFRCPSCLKAGRERDVLKQSLETKSLEQLLAEMDTKWRERVLEVYGQREDDFPDAEAYNDYVEQREDLIYTLANRLFLPEPEVKKAEATLEAERRANEAAVAMYKARREDERRRSERAAEAFDRKWAEQVRLAQERERREQERRRDYRLQVQQRNLGERDAVTIRLDEPIVVGGQPMDMEEDEDVAALAAGKQQGGVADGGAMLGGGASASVFHTNLRVIVGEQPRIVEDPRAARAAAAKGTVIDKEAVARASGWPLALRYKRCWQEAVASLFLTSPEARSRLGQQFYK